MFKVGKSNLVRALIYHAQIPNILSVNPVAQKTKERIDSARPVLLYVVFGDFAKKKRDKIAKIMDAATIHAETVNKNAIQCDVFASKKFVRNSVLKFIKMPKGIFIKLIKTANTPKSNALFAFIPLKIELVGI